MASGPALAPRAVNLTASELLLPNKPSMDFHHPDHDTDEVMHATQEEAKAMRKMLVEEEAQDPRDFLGR